MRFISFLPLVFTLYTFAVMVPSADAQRSRRRGASATASQPGLDDDDFDVPASNASQPVPPQNAASAAPETGPDGQPAPNGNAEQKKSALVFLNQHNFHLVTDTLQAVLKIAEKPAKPENEEETRAARITAAALTGDWKALQSLFSQIPDKKNAGDLYGALLAKLAATSEPLASSPPPPEVQYDQNPQRIDLDRRHFLMPRDVLGILAAAPIPVETPHLKSLKSLALSAGAGMIEPLAQTLSTGVPGLGGHSDAEARTRAARLLLSLNALEEAARFLPLDKDPTDSSVTTNQLVALIQYHTRKSALDKNEGPVLQAALVCTALTQRTDPADTVALNKLCGSLLRLLSQLEEHRAVDFLQSRILPNPALLDAVLNTIAADATRDLASINASQRKNRLNLLHRVMMSLGGSKGSLPSSARSVALHWLDEAETSIRMTADLKRSDEGRVTIGRIYGFQSPPSRFLSFEREEIERLCPPETFISKLSPDLAQRLRFARLRLRLTDPEGELTLAALKRYVELYGKSGATALAEQYLKGWSEQRSTPEEDPEFERMRQQGFFLPPEPKGLPQTRARQEIALREFKELLHTLESISGSKLSSAEKVAAFIRIHSKTEVFELGQIESVFGAAEGIDFPTLTTLLQTMRERLAKEWTDSAAQQQAGTNRTQAEMLSEASRGYDVAAELIRRNQARKTAGWKAGLQEAVLLFDSAEFHFKHKGALVDYVSERNAALAALEQAAQSYVSSVPTLRPSEWTLEPFLVWTSAMLGSTDPKKLVWKENRAEPAFAKVHALLHSLPEPALSKHLSDFGTLVQNTVENVPAQMRYKFVDALIQVIGADVREIRGCVELRKHYQELTEEARLRVRFDGPTTIRHQQPFGLIVGIEHTEKLYRESGGFSKYLQNPAALSQNNPMVFFGLRNAKQMNYRDEFQKNIHKALQDSFEFVSITYHDPSVQPVALSEPGWLFTPLAYMVLKTKDVSVDRLPPIQIDLEFAEGRAQVVLPVVSQLEPVQTSTEAQSPRPFENLELLLTLDERDWTRGKLTVDVNAKARGLIPDWEALFHPANLEGFTLSVSDQKNSVTEFVSDKTGMCARSERNWQLTFQRKTDFHGDALFRFPVLREGIQAKVETKRFVDADLFDVSPEEARKGFVVGRGRDTAIRIALFAVLGALAMWVLVRWRHVWMPSPRKEAADLPAAITPFSVISYLRNRLDAESLPGMKENIQREIADLERRCFSAQPNPPSEAELKECILRLQAQPSTI